MSEVVPRASGDGVLAVHPEDSDRFALLHPAATPHRPSSLPDNFVERLVEDQDDSLRLLARSVLGQMGINIVADGTPVLKNKGKHRGTYSPVSITAHCEIGRAVLTDLDEIRSGKDPGALLRSRSRGNVIEAGRYVDFSQYKRLEKTDTTSALANWLLAVDVVNPDLDRNYRVNEDGSLTMPLALVETLVNPYTLSSREERFNAIKHGRAGLRPHTDTVERTRDDKLPQFLIGGIALSPGPYTCVIREALDDNGKVQHLSGAVLIDGSRLMGIGKHLDPYTGHRQVEVVNLDEARTFGETSVTLDLYEYSGDAVDLNPVVDWYGMDIEQREKLHNEGVSPLDVIHISNPSARHQLSRAYKRKNIAGILMSSHGVDEVPKGETDKLTADNVEKAAGSFSRGRKIPRRLSPLKPYIEALSPAGDRSRVFAGQRLLAEYMTDIVKNGDVQSFFVEDFGHEFMDQQVHTAMLDMVNAGISIGWENESQTRVFHRSGLWVQKAEVSRLEELNFVLAMYGTHRPSVDEHLQPRIEEFFSELTKIMPPRKFGVTHGNGPGVMRMSDILAREAEMMSLGVGIAVEGQGEGERVWWPQAAVQFKQPWRLYRQQRMDKLRIASVLNLGGNGTIEEGGINVCTNKLNSAIPGPTIFVDPPGDYFEGQLAMFKQASERRRVDIYGAEVDISKQRFAQPWVANTIHRPKYYCYNEDSKWDSSAVSILETFWKDPANYWDRAKIPPNEVRKGYEAHEQEWANMGMVFADRFGRAVREYCT